MKRIRIPKFIGKKLYYITKRCEYDLWVKWTGKKHKLFTKYYLVIGGSSIT